jgi:hypothetical protein
MDIVTGTCRTFRGSNAGTGKKVFLFFDTSRPALGPTSGHRRSVPRVKQPRREVNHSPPSSAAVKNEWSYTSTPAIWFHAVERLNFTFSFIG